MQNEIKQLLAQAVQVLLDEKTLEMPVKIEEIQLEHTRDPRFGDWACNLALMLAKAAKKNPRALAELIVKHLPASELVTRVEIAGPGFINFTLAESAYLATLPIILKEGAQYGQSHFGQKKKVYLEFVSANPTGPLHVGHGRGAAYGACLGNILQASGFIVHREYYVNDAGRQMRILALSVWLRYLEKLGEKVMFPPNAYRGEYIIAIAKKLSDDYDTTLKRHAADIMALLKEDAEKDPELFIDAYIEAAIKLMGQENFDVIRQLAMREILDDIKDDLAEFGVLFDEWFMESELMHSGLVQEGILVLEEHGYVYEKDGAKWFRATALGDEKDRVLVRANGQITYFASDVAYHLHKYNTGTDFIIDIFGADHHGYMERIRAFLKGLGRDPEKLKILLVQFAILYRGQEKVAMSTRAGEFVTLRELRYEVGNDAARFFYVMRKPEQHLDFDLDLAKSQSNENPVFYIQYAHARICSVWRQLEESGDKFIEENGQKSLHLLSSDYEKRLLRALHRFPEIIEIAAKNYEPHLLVHFLQDLANAYHTYYNAERFLIEDLALRGARLYLNLAVQITLQNGLKLLGVSAPKQM